jgi:hypothetical protein
MQIGSVMVGVREPNCFSAAGEVVHRNYVSLFGLFRECKIEEWKAEFERRCNFRVSGELGGDASQKMVRRQADG